MAKHIVISGIVVFFVAFCSVLNPSQKINQLEYGIEGQQKEIATLEQQQIKGLKAKQEQQQHEPVQAVSTPAAAEEVKPEIVPRETQADATTIIKAARDRVKPNITRIATSTLRTTTTSTTIDDNRVLDKSQMSLEELELAFHEERYRQLIEAPEDDMLVWNASVRWGGDGVHKGGHRKYDRLLDHFDYCEIFSRKGRLPRDKPCHFILARGDKSKMGGICHAASAVNRHRKQYNVSLPHVLLFSFHEDYGGMRIAPEQKYKCNGVWEYINHPATLGAFTVQTHYTDHPKIHSIALGYRFLKHGNAIHESLHNHTARDSVNKKKMVMFNNNIAHAKAARKTTLETLQAKFASTNSPITNTFSKKNTLANYYHEMTESMFIASPIGLGGDCYRNYEAIFNGCIPLIEIRRQKDGWRRIFDDLPVAWVQQGFHEVTPEWVASEYRRILEGGPYNWKKTLRSWWIVHIHSLVDNYLASSSASS